MNREFTLIKRTFVVYKVGSLAYEPGVAWDASQLCNSSQL